MQNLIALDGTGRNNANDLNSVGGVREHNRTSANAVDRDTVDQVSVPIVQPRTNIAREETQRRRLDGGESKPADFSSRFQDSVGWVETYKALWEFKTTRWEKDRS